MVNEIYNTDSRNMNFIPDNSIDLVVTSPPYNAGIKYDVHNDNLPEDEYEQLLFDVFLECNRVLKNGGRLCVNIAGTGRRPYVFLPYVVEKVIRRINEVAEIPYNNRGVIIWDKGASVGPSTAWGSWCSPSNPTLRDVHEFILVYSKGDYKLQHKGETDLTRNEFVEWTKSIWRFQTANAKAVGHPAPFPIELPTRLIKLYTYIGDVVLDPFCGAGTTCLAAKRLGRRYIGIDISPNYCQLARENLAKE